MFTRASHPRFKSMARHFSLRRTSIAVSQACLVLGLGSIHFPDTYAYAAGSDATESTVRQYDIPAGPLDSSLTNFAKEAGVTVSFIAELVEGKRSPALQGTFETNKALHQLLLGSALEAVYQGNRIYVLRPIRQSGFSNDDSVLPAVSVTAARDATTEGTGSYAARGTKMFKGTAELKDIPQSVSVITSQQIEDQKLTDMSSIMAQAPGVYSDVGYSATYGRRQGQGDYYIRSFIVDSYMIDGVPAYAMGDNSGRNNTGLSGSSAIYDRVEILRGAAGLLIGNGSAGGTVNLVRKRPTEELQQNYSMSAGSWNAYQWSADISGPLFGSDMVRGRFIAAYDDKDRFWEITHSQSPLLYGIIEADISSQTRLTAGIRYDDYKETAPSSSSFDGSTFVPQRKRLYNADWGYKNDTQQELFFGVKHQFSPSWQLETNANYVNNKYHQVKAGTIYVQNFFGTQIQPLRGESSSYNIDSSLTGAFSLFGRTHQLVIGANASKRDFVVYGGNCRSWQGCFNFNFDPDTFDPHTSFPLTDSLNSSVAALLARKSYTTDSRSYGVFAKSTLELTDQLKAIIGGRLSWYDHTYNNSNDIAVPGNGGKVNKEFTPYAGLVYTLNPQWNVYASYADIFKPQWGYFKRDGTTIDHELGRSVELGIKGSLLNGRLNTAFAIYQVDLKNSAQSDVPPYDQICDGNPTGEGCSVSTGHKRTRGFDAELSGEITPNWNMTAGYTYTQTEVLKADEHVGGAIAATVDGDEFPRHMFKAWTSYQMNQLAPGLTLGGGVNVSSQQRTYGKVVQGSTTIWNAFARYVINRTWSANLNINNVFDKVYFVNGAATSKSLYADPRNVTLTIQAKF